MEVTPSFTCITCRVVFQDANLQRDHYKTDWHRYNLKRKVADMPPVTAENFQERLQAIKLQEADQCRDSSSHCSLCNKHFSTENSYQNHIKSKKHREAAQKHDTESESCKAQDENSQTEILEKNKINDMKKRNRVTTSSLTKEDTSNSNKEDDDSDWESVESWDGEALKIEDCLFCSHVSKTLEKNLKHMTLAHSFFVPDLEYVCDLEGLVKYLGEKVGEGHICLWCNEKSKTFLTTKSVQQHMVDKGHCKMFLDDDAVFEYADFYDYRSSYPDYVPGEEVDDEVADGDEEQEQDGTEAAQNDEENYQLVLPSGAVIGHRSLMRYYRQKLRPDRQVAVYNRTPVSRVMAEYKALGWTGITGQLAQKRAKDLSYFHRLSSKRHLMVGVKANKLQKHYRDQVFGY